MGVWNKLHQIISRSSETTSTPVNFEEAERIIGYHFHDKELLRLSLTHRSYAYVQDEYPRSNERLEFLGDSVLGLIIAELLFKDHPNLREGELTKLKALLVSETTLAEVAIKSGLNNYLLLAPEEDRAGGRERPSIVSDAFESILGAVFLDGGIGAVRDVIVRLLYSKKDSITSDSSRRNFKGELLELMQARGEGMPRYDVVSESGPDHDKTFSVDVYVGGKKVGLGTGHSKKEAEQKAASAALEHFRKQDKQ